MSKLATVFFTLALSSVSYAGIWDFFKPRAPEAPPREWNAMLPEESISQYGLDWFQYYDLIVVINKAQTGPTAQRAIVYYKGEEYGTFVVSTGRENWENPKNGSQYFSSTPTGWYSPTWLSRNHVSETWEAKMPYAVFFNGGIATHAALPPYYKLLGRRASGGCVRLLPEQARWIFDTVQSSGKGLVPQFSPTGEPVLDNNGSFKLVKGWKSIFIVVNREGY